MRSDRPKVLHEAAGRPLLSWVVDAARAAGCERIVVVIGHGGDEVKRACAGPDLEWVVQRERLGTGHALGQASAVVEEEVLLLVLSGDVPLVTASTLNRLAEATSEGWGAMAVAAPDDPGRLGRVIAEDGDLVRIVEASDASDEELAVERVNAGVYALPSPEIFGYLRELDPDNVQGELYLTDAVTSAAAEHQVALVELEEVEEALGVNTREELGRAHRALVRRQIERLMEAGVTVLDPRSTTVEAGVEVDRDTILHAGVSLLGTTRVGSGCVLYAGAWVRDAEVGEEVEIAPYSVVDGARVGDRCRIGPYARLRPGAELERDVKLGNFVEVKKARLGDGAKVSHLAYIGDAEVGAGANIGAGVVTCNYDGVAKHRTEIGSDAFIGSDTMLVAPVRIGDGATTAAGSVITRDVPDGALGVARSRQRNVEEWRRRGRGDEGEPSPEGS